MDKHCQDILNQYKECKPLFCDIQKIVVDNLESSIKKAGVWLAQVESRIKTEESLTGKLELKGNKYRDLFDITDILGCRIITFYNDELDTVAAMIEKQFNIDWDNSIDKRKVLESDRFGYLSIHYICSIPKELYYDEDHPEFNDLKFEIQIKTYLQHTWAMINHDMGYKTDVEIPIEYKRRISRLAGLLELADDEFARFRKDIAEYRGKVRSLIQDGKFDDISLNRDSYSNYMSLDPFKRLTDSIAASLKAEVTDANLYNYFNVFKELGLNTLGDVERMKKEYSEEAKRFALHRMGGLELDIMSSTVALSNLCIVYALKQGYGENGLKKILDIIYDDGKDHTKMAERIIKQAAASNILEG